MKEKRETKSGKLYRNNVSPPKDFSLRLHPVPIDREQVVKIALKLFEQVQIDERIKGLSHMGEFNIE